MDFSILGPVEAAEGGRALALGGPRQRALLAYLLVHANRVVAADRLVDELWATPPRDAHAALQNQVSRLRKALGDRLVTRAPGYLIRVEDGELDLDRFRTTVAAAGSTADPRERARLLREAAALFRGTPFAEIDAPFAAAEAAALEELRLAAVEARIDADLERGRQAELVPELAALVARQPLRERLRAQQILALYRCGRQAEALEAYRATRTMLADELGLEPSPDLRELERAILRHDPALAQARVDDEPRRPVVAALVPGRRRSVLAAAAAVALAAAGVGAALLLRNDPTRAPAAIASPRAYPVAHRRAVVRAVHAKPALHRSPRRRTRRHVVTAARVRVSTPPPSHKTPHVSAPAPAPATSATTTVTARPVPPPTHPTTTSASRPPANVTPTITTETVAAPPSSWRVFSDDFGSTTPNWAMWQPWYDGSGASYAQQNGRLEMTLDANSQLGGTYNLVSVSFGSNCRWDGDFDARVDYQLLTWPSDAGARVQLNAWTPPDGSADIARASNQYGDTYDGDLSGTWTVYPTNDTHGTFRIARSGATVKSYYLDKGQWVLLHSGTLTAEVMIGLQLFGDQQDWAHKTVRAAFDNFSIAAPQVSCR